MLAALMQERWVRSGVRIKPTSVSADVNGMGLYAPAAERLHRGSFVGVYRANLWRRARAAAFLGFI